MTSHTVVCAKCGHQHPNDRIYDATPCEQCGAPLTAFMTDAAGKRMSEAEYFATLVEHPNMTATQVLQRMREE